MLCGLSDGRRGWGGQERRDGFVCLLDPRQSPGKRHEKGVPVLVQWMVLVVVKSYGMKLKWQMQGGLSCDSHEAREHHHRPSHATRGALPAHYSFTQHHSTPTNTTHKAVDPASNTRPPARRGNDTA